MLKNSQSLVSYDNFFEKIINVILNIGNVFFCFVSPDDINGGHETNFNDRIIPVIFHC